MMDPMRGYGGAFIRRFLDSKAGNGIGTICGQFYQFSEITDRPPVLRPTSCLLPNVAVVAEAVVAVVETFQMGLTTVLAVSLGVVAVSLRMVAAETVEAGLKRRYVPLEAL